MVTYFVMSDGWYFTGPGKDGMIWTTDIDCAVELKKSMTEEIVELLENWPRLHPGKELSVVDALTAFDEWEAMEPELELRYIEIGRGPTKHGTAPQRPPESQLH